MAKRKTACSTPQVGAILELGLEKNLIFDEDNSLQELSTGYNKTIVLKSKEYWGAILQFEPDNEKAKTFYKKFCNIEEQINLEAQLI